MKQLFALLLCATMFSAKANNVTITNFSYLTATNELKFDISWENSWRNTNVVGSTKNYDGVWVFAKFRAACAKDSISPSDYRHVWLNTTVGQHTIPAGFSGTVGTTAINSTDRGMGLFLYRSADGTGTVTLTNVKMKWDVASQGVIGTDWDVQVFALEMVYIPQGPYYLGDKTSGRTFREHETGNPYLIDSETAGGLLQNSMKQYLSDGSMNYFMADDYPKAYNAFWTMKYEVTQGQYVDYLNVLSRNSQAFAAPNCYTSLGVSNTAVTAANRFAFSSTVSTGVYLQLRYRNGIRILGPADTTSSITISPSKPVTFVCDLSIPDTANSINDGQSIACNYLQPVLLFKYLDWAGLRPMNEFEFEKICRGPAILPVAYQYPGTSVWGVSPSVGPQASGTGLVNGGAPTEALTVTPNGTGLVVTNVNSGAMGPRRVGITQVPGGSRLDGGVSYYGAADMAGNVAELCLHPHTSMFAYTRNTHGDGEVSTLIGWPYSLRTVNYGVCTRGGSWANSVGTIADFRISERIVTTQTVSWLYNVNTTPSDSFTENAPESQPSASRGFTVGGRGVRQAQ